MVEILAGGNFEQAVKSLDLTSAICTYRYTPSESGHCTDYQVWELSDEDFSNICSVNEEDWKEDWGWWRHAAGSNLGAVNSSYIVNGESLMAWDGVEREEWCDECGEKECAATDEDRCECYHERKYPDIITYLCNEIGASVERNVCACAIDLAKQNNMKLSELFKKYLG